MSERDSTLILSLGKKNKSDQNVVTKTRGLLLPCVDDQREGREKNESVPSTFRQQQQQGENRNKMAVVAGISGMRKLAVAATLTVLRVPKAC